MALGRRVCLLNPLSTAWSELPFPGGGSSPDPEAGLSLLGGLCVACTSHGAAQGRPAFSEFWDVGPDIRSTVSNALSSLHPGISCIWQSQIRPRGCQEVITRALSFGMLALKVLSSHLSV